MACWRLLLTILAAIPSHSTAPKHCSQPPCPHWPEAAKANLSTKAVCTASVYALHASLAPEAPRQPGTGSYCSRTDTCCLLLNNQPRVPPIVPFGQRQTTDMCTALFVDGSPKLWTAKQPLGPAVLQPHQAPHHRPKSDVHGPPHSRALLPHRFVRHHVCNSVQLAAWQVRRRTAHAH